MTTPLNKKVIFVENILRADKFDSFLLLKILFNSGGSRLEHYRVRYMDDSKLTVDDETYFENLTKLVEVGSEFKLIAFLCYRSVEGLMVSVLDSGLSGSGSSHSLQE